MFRKASVCLETSFKKERCGKLTITEAGKQYKIPVDILQEYTTLGLAKNTKKSIVKKDNWIIWIIFDMNYKNKL